MVCIPFLEQQALLAPSVLPPVVRLKWNIDVARFTLDNLTSYGICLRDHQGAFVLAKSGWTSPLLLVHEGEAIGLLKAMQWVGDLNLEFVSFELHYKMVVDQLKSNKEDNSEFVAILAHCKEFFFFFFTFKL